MAACSAAKQVSPAAEFQSAAQRLGAEKALTTTVDITASAPQLTAALSGEKDFKAQDATALAGLHASVTVSSAKPLKDSKTGSADFRIFYGSGELMDFREIDGSKTVFVRADFKQLAGLVRTTDSSADAKQLEALVTAAGKLPSSYASVKNALTGKWFSIDPQSFQEFAKTMGDATGSGSGSAAGSLPSFTTPDPKTAQQVADALRKVVRDDAKFTAAGSGNGVDRIRITMPARKAAQGFAQAVKPLAAQLPKGALSGWQKVPDKNFVMVAAVKDGTLQSVSVNLTQLDTKAKGPVPLTLGFASAPEPVRAPAGAVQLNPQDIMGAIMSLMSKGSPLSGLQ